MSNLVNYETNVVQLLIDDETIEDSLKEAVAAIANNPYITWAKFTLTDDKPNKNKQRVPEEEFDNLVKSGVHMPIKMAEGGISDGHDFTFPIGTITHLKKFKDRIVGLAALWYSERPEDVGIIKDKFNKKEPLNLSWELSYSDSNENDGITDLRGVNLKAATLVGIPAYAGRTQITAVASENNEGDKTLEELEKIKGQLDESQSEVAELKNKISEMESTASDAQKELDELRSYKSEIEAEKERAERLESIKNKFSEAGIEKEDSYFEEKKEVLLGLDEAALDFFVQEAVAFAAKDDKKDKDEQASAKKIPGFVSDKNEDYSMKELAEALRS